MPDPDVLRALRASTRAAHTRVEDLLAIGGADVRLDRVVAAVDLLGAFWAGTEPLVEAWFGTEPALAERLDWGRRRTTPARQQDLARLGAHPSAPTAPPVFAAVGPAEVLGWLYVREGSTLGGAVLQRRLAPLLGDVVLTTFTPYAEGPGPLWRSYLQVLDDLVACGRAEQGAVCDAAGRTFGALEAHAGAALAEPAA